MRNTKEELEEMRNMLLEDERITEYPAADITINAPLALIQVSLKTKVWMLDFILERPRTKLPL